MEQSKSVRFYVFSKNPKIQKSRNLQLRVEVIFVALSREKIDTKEKFDTKEKCDTKSKNPKLYEQKVRFVGTN